MLFSGLNQTSFMRTLKPTTLIAARHMGETAVLEVDANMNEGDVLALILHPNPKAGGDMNSKVVTTLYRFCRDHGMDVVRFNYRGVGKSSGQIEYGQGEYLDTLCVLEWALTQSRAKTLWLAGFSFGGFIACRVADYLLCHRPEIRLQKLTLIAPSIEKNNPSGLILPKDTLMIYGDQDEFVKPSSMADFAEEFHVRSKIMSDTGHFFHGRLGELKTMLEV